MHGKDGSLECGGHRRLRTGSVELGDELPLGMLGLDLEHDRLLDLVQGPEGAEQGLGPDDAFTHGLLTPAISVEVVEHVEMIVVEQQVGIGFECGEGLLIVAGCVEGGQNIRLDRQISVLECGDERAGAEDGTMIGHHLGREKVEIGTVILVRGDLFQNEGVFLVLELCHPCLYILVRRSWTIPQ